MRTWVEFQKRVLFRLEVRLEELEEYAQFYFTR
jgi:hypothetical protein